MSCNCNNTRQKTAGPCGNSNPLNGLCERVSVLCDKVLDSCIKRETLYSEPVVLSGVPEGLQAPFSFVSANSTASNIENLVVTRSTGKECFANVQFDLVVTLDVRITDAAGTASTVVGTIRKPKDIIMYIGEESINPYVITSEVVYKATKGEHRSETQMDMDLCVINITRVVIRAEVLLPSYGYTGIREERSANNMICRETFETPLYPNGPQCDN